MMTNFSMFQTRGQWHHICLSYFRVLVAFAHPVALMVSLTACGGSDSSGGNGGGGGTGGTGGSGGGRSLCAPAGDWTIHEVPDTTKVGNKGLALDANGLPGIAYVTVNSLRYAEPADAALTTWNDEEIESVFATKVEGLVKPARPVIDGDEVHMVYWINQVTSPFGSPIKHAQRVGGAWQAEEIGQGGVASGGLSASGGSDLHLAYGNSGGLFHQTYTGGAWSQPDNVESSKVTGGTVGTGGDAAIFIHAGVTHMYFYNARDEVRHATGQPGAWTAEAILQEYDVIGSDDLIASAMDPSGKAHLLLSAPNTRDALWHYSDESGSWASTEIYPERPDGDPIRAWRPAIATDTAGGLHAAIRPDDCDGLLYLTRVNGEWRKEVVDPEVTGTARPSIAVGADGRPRISYGSKGSLRFAVRK